MSWSLNLRHDATMTIEGGSVLVHRADGSTETHVVPAFVKIVIGPLTEKGRLVELRSQ